MMENSIGNSIELKRITAIILLVRLQNADIPYPHSKKCREQMCKFLTYLLTDEENDRNYFLIERDDLAKIIEDTDTAYNIIKGYAD